MKTSPPSGKILSPSYFYSVRKIVHSEEYIQAHPKKLQNPKYQINNKREK